jgi:hypothetical protein
MGQVPGYVIRAAQSAPFPGWYLKSAGSTDAYWTPAPADAVRFTSFAAAVNYWDSVPPGLGAFFPVSVEEAP